jgi:Flp pilus assembly pilin Flp
MKQTFHFLKDESGQDLIEYSLLVGFIAVASVAAYLGGGSSISSIWGDTSGQLSAATAVAVAGS